MLGLILLFFAVASWAAILFRAVFLMKCHAKHEPLGFALVINGLEFPAKLYDPEEVGFFLEPETKYIPGLPPIKYTRYLDLPITCNHQYERMVLSGSCKQYSYYCVICGEKS